MKKVLIFSLAYYPYVGGAEVAIKEITDRISPNDIEFHMVTQRFSVRSLRYEQIGHVHVHRIGRGMGRLAKFLFQFFAALTALRLNRRWHFEGIWAMMAHSSGVPAALFKLVHPRMPMVLTLQEGDPPAQVEHTMWPLWPLFSRAFTHTDAVQAISTFLGEWARRRHFTGPLEIIPNGVDTVRFAKVFTPEEREAARQELEVSSNDVLLVTTSRLVRKNATDDTIRALAHLPSQVHFIIYGIGPDEAMLKTLAAELKVENRVHFMGQISHEAMLRALAACDIFIRPSRSEGMGNSFIEAMAAGLPIIATQEGGIADFLFDAKRNPDKETTGWAVDADAPEQIAHAVEDIRANPGVARAVVEQAKNLALEHYDWNLITGKMHALFDKLLV